MADPIALLVGLGNPGPRYGDTRHNAGYWLLDAVASRCAAALRATPRYFGEVGECRCGAHRLRLLKPTTFMNASGRAVAALARFYRMPAAAILVAHDDIDLPPGTVRLKRGGGDGGHKGLRDIIACLGSREFARLRIGIGHAATRDEVIDYVLRRPPANEQADIDQALERVLAEIEPLIGGEFDRVMNQLHRRTDVELG